MNKKQLLVFIIFQFYKENWCGHYRFYNGILCFHFFQLFTYRFWLFFYEFHFITKMFLLSLKKWKKRFKLCNLLKMFGIKSMQEENSRRKKEKLKLILKLKKILKQKIFFFVNINVLLLFVLLSTIVFLFLFNLFIFTLQNMISLFSYFKFLLVFFIIKEKQKPYF